MTAVRQQWTHDALAADLAVHLRAGGERYTWQNIALGSSGAPRPDVYTFTPFRFSSPEAVVYEVKISVADFRSDVTSGKWQKYLAFSQGVTFAAPHGLVTLADVPTGCGLILRSDRAWRHVRRPTLQRLNLPMESMCKLLSMPPDRGVVNPHSTRGLFDEQMRIRRNAEERVLAHARREVGKRIGQDMAELLRAPESARAIIERAKADAELIRKTAASRGEDADKLLAEIGHALGVEGGASIWKVRQAWNEARRRVDAAGEVQAIRSATEEARRALDRVMHLASVEQCSSNAQAVHEACET